MSRRTWVCPTCGFTGTIPPTCQRAVCVAGHIDDDPQAHATDTRPRPVRRRGAGAELKKILSWFRIRPNGKCRCNDHAAKMDTYGLDWCRRNTDTIVGWLREEAYRRRIPFVDAAGRVAVRWAIRRAAAAERSSQA